MKAGDTFIPKKFEHLWIILSDPSLDPENVVIVNFTTHTVDEEQVCIVQRGEHSFIKHKTAVRYRDAKKVSLSILQHLQKTKMLKVNDPLSPTLLARVRRGAAVSAFLPEECKEVLDNQGLI